MMPIANPPATAPSGLAMPPSSAPAKAYSSTPDIMFGSRNTTGAIIIPATAPIAAASPQPSASMRADADAHQAAGHRVVGGGAHRQAELGEAEERPHRQQHRQRDAVAPRSCRVTKPPSSGRPSNGRGELLQRVAEQPAGDAVEDQQQPDEHADARQHRRPGQRRQQHALDHGARSRTRRHRDRERDPVRQPGLDQRQRDVGREHRHLALGEVHVVRRLEDHHQRQRDAGVDAARGDPGEESGGSNPSMPRASIAARYERRTALVAAGSRAPAPTGDDAPGFEQAGLVRQSEREAGVLLDQQDADAVLARMRRMMSKISRTISGARPKDGSSSSSRRGRSSSARPIASICCSPPDSVPACCCSRWRSSGK